MTFSAEDVQTAERNNFLVLGLDDAFGLQEFLLPLRFVRFVRIDFLLFQELARHEVRIAAEQNVRAAAGHVRRDRHHALAAGLRDDFGFAFVILRVQNVVRHAGALQTARNQFGVFHRHRADQHRLAFLVQLFDLFDDRVPFFGQRAIDHVRIVLANHRHVRRNYHHVEFVSRMKLGRFGFRGTGHARKFFVKTEIILQRDRRERLVLALDLHAFLGFDGLVQSIRPATAFHQASGEVIDDDHFAVLHDILMVEPVKRVRLQSLLDAVQQFHVAGIVKIADAQQPFGFINAFFGQDRRVVLFIDHVVAGLLVFFQLFAANELRNDRVRLVVLVGRFFRRT